MDKPEIFEYTPQELQTYNKQVLAKIASKYHLINENSKENLIKDIIDYQAKNGKSKVGAILCHGKEHTNIAKNYSNLVDYWVYIDEDPEAKPDVVGDIYRSKTIEEAQSLSYKGYFDVVLPYHCPVSPDMDEILTFTYLGKLYLSRNDVVRGNLFIGHHYITSIDIYLMVALSYESFAAIRKEASNPTTKVYKHYVAILNKLEKKVGAKYHEINGKDVYFYF